MIDFNCERCGTKYSIREEVAGRAAKCGCGNIMVIPESNPVRSDPNFHGLGARKPISETAGGRQIATSKAPQRAFFNKPIVIGVAMLLIGLAAGILIRDKITSFDKLKTMLGLLPPARDQSTDTNATSATDTKTAAEIDTAHLQSANQPSVNSAMPAPTSQSDKEPSVAGKYGANTVARPTVATAPPNPTDPAVTRANTPPPAKETYRVLTKEDGIQFAIRGGLYYANLPGGPAEQNTISAFVLIDSAGKSVALDLEDNHYSSDSMFIKTTLFADQIVNARDDTFAATETQVKKIHDFLSARAKSNTDTWTDPRTGLMWATKDNGSEVGSQSQAADYCKNLALAGFHDWRLPTIDELTAIYDGQLGGAFPAVSNLNDPGRLKGGISAVRFEWSSSHEEGKDLMFDFETGNRTSGWPLCRVIAVRLAAATKPSH